MKKVFALILAAMLMVTGVAAAKGKVTVYIKTPMDIIEDKSGVKTITEKYEKKFADNDKKVLDVLAVTALQKDEATLTFSQNFKEKDGRIIYTLFETEDHFGRLGTALNTDGSVTVDFTAEAMDALMDGGYVIFIDSDEVLGRRDVTPDGYVTIINNLVDGCTLTGTYPYEGVVMDEIQVVAQKAEAVALTFTFETAFEGNIVAIVLTDGYTEELPAVVDNYANVTVDMTPDSMAALQNGGYILFVQR